MSQFILIEREFDTQERFELVVRPVVINNDLFESVANHYFGSSCECREIVSEQGPAQTLLDAVWSAQTNGASVEETTIVRFLAVAVRSGVRFVIWCSSEFADLPTAHVWGDVLAELKRQALFQPTDVYLSFVPVEGLS